MTSHIETGRETAPASGFWRRRASVLAKMMLALGLLAWLFTSGRLDLTNLGSISHGRYLAVAAMALLVSMVLQAFRWLLLLRIQQLRVGWILAVKLYWFGRFAGLFLPGAAGGDLVKAYAVCRQLPNAKMRAVSTVALDRALGGHALLSIGSVAGICLLLGSYSPRQAAAVTFVFLCLLGASAVLLALQWRRSARLAIRILPGRFRQSMTSSLELYRQSSVSLLGVWLLSVLCYIFSFSSYCLVAVALDVRVSLDQILAIALVIVSISLPITPGGLGIGEAVGSELYADFGVADGALIVLIVRLLVAVVALPGALMLLTPFGPSDTTHRQEDLGNVNAARFSGTADMPPASGEGAAQ